MLYIAGLQTLNFLGAFKVGHLSSVKMDHYTNLPLGSIPK